MRFACTFGLAVSLVALGSAHAVEPPRGESHELGIEFAVRGAALWCGPNVRVDLLSKRRSAFNLEGEAFAKMLARLRAVVQSECPQVERIRFEAKEPNDKILFFELTRLGQWQRIMRLTTNGVPECGGSARCERKATTYAIAHRLLRGELFQNFVIVPADVDHTTWRVGDIFGRIAILDLPTPPAAEINRDQIALQLSTAIATTCTQSGGTPEQLEAPLEKARTTLQVVRCKSASDAVSQALFLIEHEGKLIALSMTGPLEAEEQIVEIATAVVQKD
jgi:hypothetical protein